MLIWQRHPGQPTTTAASCRTVGHIIRLWQQRRELYNSRSVSTDADSAGDTDSTGTIYLAADDNKDVLVVCELLYFAINVMDRHHMTTIKSVIYNFYRNDEIVLAKQKLIAALPNSAKAAPISQ